MSPANLNGCRAQMNKMNTHGRARGRPGILGGWPRSALGGQLFQQANKVVYCPLLGGYRVS